MKYNKFLIVGTVCTAGINIVSCGTQHMSSSKVNPENVDHKLLATADEGHAEAQYRYGQCLSNGKGVERNVQEAARYFKLAADQGHDDVQIIMEYVYY